MTQLCDRSIDVESYLNTLPEDAILIYSPTSLRAFNFKNHKARSISYHEYQNDSVRIKRACHTLTGYRTVVSIGGGSPTDTAKYMSYLTGAECICIPSVLSTNAYSTNKVALLKGSLKVTLDAKLPDKILLDTNLIAKAGNLNLTGLADVLSIHTALYDWRLSCSVNKEKIDYEIYARASSLLRSAIKYILNTDSSFSPDDINNIYELIEESGRLTNEYGSGRPESGSEHIFAKALEAELDVPHGVSVGLGILIMSQLQNSYSADIARCISKLGLISRLEQYSINRELIKRILLQLKPRADRFTILNTKDLTDDNVSVLMDELSTSWDLIDNEEMLLGRYQPIPKVLYKA